MSVPCSHSRLYGPPRELLPHPLHGLMLRDDFRIVADGRSPATGIGSVRAHFCTPWKNRALLLCGSQGHVNCRTLEIHRLERHVLAFKTALIFRESRPDEAGKLIYSFEMSEVSGNSECRRIGFSRLYSCRAEPPLRRDRGYRRSASESELPRFCSYSVLFRYVLCSVG